MVSLNHKPIFLTKTRSYRYDRYDSSSVRNQGVWKTNHKEKYLGKQLEQDRNEDQNQDPKYSIFLWFFQPLKTNKDKFFLTQKLC